MRHPKRASFGASISAFALGAIVATELLAISLVLPNSGAQSEYLAAVYPKVLIAFANDARKREGVPTLKTSVLLTEAAQMKADDMAKKGYFAHESPGGEEPWDWIAKTGYVYRAAGENLAVNFKDSKTLHQAWMDSPGHRANIVRNNFTEIGIASSIGSYKGRTVMFVVEMFGTPIDAPVTTLTPAKRESTHALLPTAIFAQQASISEGRAVLHLLLASPITAADSLVLGIALLALLTLLGGAYLLKGSLRIAVFRASIIAGSATLAIIINACLLTVGGSLG